MTELPYMPVHVADAIADASGLTNAELGALWRIRWALWRAGGLLSVGKLVRASGAGRGWNAVSPVVLERLQVYGGMASCQLVTTILVLTRQRRAARSAAGKESARARGSEGVQKSSSEGVLNSRKPLNFHGADRVLLEQTPNNHKQNQKQPGSSGAVLFTPTTAAPAAAPAGLAKEEVQAQQDALYRDGVQLLMERSRVTRAQASREVTRWLHALGGDAEAVSAFMALADRENFTGHAFGRMVTEFVERRQRETTLGYSLPFGPVARAVQGGRR